MIYGLMHQGSGLGNQLHRYVATRALAFAKDEKFGIVAPKLFKGKSFMNLNMGEEVSSYYIEYPAGKVIPENIEGHILDGEFQNEAIWKGILPKVKRWLHTEPIDVDENTCVINFRGGEYKYFPELFLPKEYWDLAIKMMIDINPNMKFEVHTDDPEEAKKFFPDYPVIQDIGINWRSIRNAPYLILSNSSFAILPAYLGDAKKIIAPKYWARYNSKEWIDNDNATYSKFEYIHHEESYH